MRSRSVPKNNSSFHAAIAISNSDEDEVEALHLKLILLSHGHLDILSHVHVFASGTAAGRYS